ncbi:unnamed protein product, partial [Scytosiphon promiscuus]
RTGGYFSGRSSVSPLFFVWTLVLAFASCARSEILRQTRVVAVEIARGVTLKSTPPALPRWASHTSPACSFRCVVSFSGLSHRELEIGDSTRTPRGPGREGLP